jgi:uncharacterized protein (DUF302 family)
MALANRKVEHFQGSRITISTSTSYDHVLEKLKKEIARNGVINAEEMRSAILKGKDDFVEYVSRSVGPSGFVQFHDFNHGPWIKLFNVGDGLRLQRFVLGNPLIAITMIQHDLYSGLFVPVELLLKETHAGGTEVVYVLPSSLIAGINPDQQLQAAAIELDRKLDMLVTGITA